MVNKVDTLLNFKDASGVLNEIYPITKKENVLGLAEFISNSLLGYAKKTDLDGYAIETEVDTKLENYLPKSGGTLTGALTLKSAPTADLQAATKKCVDDKAPLVINASTLTDSNSITNAFNLIYEANEAGRIVLLKDYEVYAVLTYCSREQAIFSHESNGIVREAWIFATGNMQSKSININYISRTVTLSSTGWTASGDVYTQTATVSGVSATETAQEIHVTPATASMTAYMEAGVYASAQAANQITFTASEKPTADLTVYAVIRTL